MIAARQLDAALALAGMGFRQAFAERLGLIGRVLLYGLVLLIFAGVWQATPLREIPGLGYDSQSLIWYVAVTEWIVFAVGYPYRQVEADVLKGRIAWLAQRPLPYAVQVAAEWTGAAGFRAMVLGLFGFALTVAMTGTLPIGPAAAPGLAASAVLSMALLFLLQLSIGFVAVWLRTAAPIWWVAQKSFFVMGGLLLPLSIYPDGLRLAAEASPFAAMLYWPASLVFEPAGWAMVMLRQAAWLAALIGLAWLAQQRALARVHRNGE
jgi:ABC-2 type transport system permease protein